MIRNASSQHKKDVVSKCQKKRGKKGWLRISCPFSEDFQRYNRYCQSVCNSSGCWVWFKHETPRLERKCNRRERRALHSFQILICFQRKSLRDLAKKEDHTSSISLWIRSSNSINVAATDDIERAEKVVFHKFNRTTLRRYRSKYCRGRCVLSSVFKSAIKNKEPTQEVRSHFLGDLASNILRLIA